LRFCLAGLRNFSLAWRFGFFTFPDPRTMAKELRFCRLNCGDFNHVSMAYRGIFDDRAP
jgi:hypothetical protein